MFQAEEPQAISKYVADRVASIRQDMLEAGMADQLAEWNRLIQNPAAEYYKSIDVRVD